jgi:hypothetical protein
MVKNLLFTVQGKNESHMGKIGLPFLLAIKKTYLPHALVLF